MRYLYGIPARLSACLSSQSWKLATILWNGLPNTLKKVSSIKNLLKKLNLFCGQQTPIVRISSCVSNVTNSVTDNIFQLIVDFWHMLLVNDDDDVGFSLFFCTTLLCFAKLLLLLLLLLFVCVCVCACACGCVHD